MIQFIAGFGSGLAVAAAIALYVVWRTVRHVDAPQPRGSDLR
jgi:hypothetical protein